MTQLTWPCTAWIKMSHISKWQVWPCDLHNISHSGSRQVISETFPIRQLDRKTQNCLHGNTQLISNVVSNIKKRHFGIVTMVTHSHSTAASQTWKWNFQELFPRWCAVTLQPSLWHENKWPYLAMYSMTHSESSWVIAKTYSIRQLDIGICNSSHNEA